MLRKNPLMNTDKDTVIMPRELTAENGAKKIFIGEYYEEVVEQCKACDGDGYNFCNGYEENCEECCGCGTVTVRIMVTWPTIKEIYKRAVKHFGVETKK